MRSSGELDRSGRMGCCKSQYEGRRREGGRVGRLGEGRRWVLEMRRLEPAREGIDGRVEGEGGKEERRWVEIARRERWGQDESELVHIGREGDGRLFLAGR